jgi:hypothetical protein
MSKSQLEIGNICFFADMQYGVVPAVVEERYKRESRTGSENYYVFISGPPNNRKRLTEKELGGTPTYSSIEEMRESLLRGAHEWVEQQCAMAAERAKNWYGDLFNDQHTESPVVSGRSIIKEILDEEEKQQRATEQDPGPEVKITKPRGRPPANSKKEK